RDPIAHLAPVELDLRFAGALAADTAALAIAAAALAQARRHVREARNLHLETRLAAARVPLEDGENDRTAIEHLGARGALEVARLRWRDVVIDEHHRRARRIGRRRLVGGLGRRVVV